MLCPRPIDVTFKGKVPCGQCMPCRVNQQRMTAGRALLELQLHHRASFVTLTYADEHLPLGEGGEGILIRSDFQKFMKRLRKNMARKFRYLACGEYGDRYQRPHYHAIIYGLGHWEGADLEQAWGKGFITISEVTPERCMYMAGYCLKKWTARALNSEKSGDFVARRLQGRPPEFTLCSQGLGDGMVRELAGYYFTSAGSAALAQELDISGTFRYKGKTWPMSYRHKQMVRGIVGVPEKAVERQALGVDADCDFSPEKVARATAAETRLWNKLRHGTKPQERGAGVSSPNLALTGAVPSPRPGISTETRTAFGQRRPHTPTAVSE